MPHQPPTSNDHNDTPQEDHKTATASARDDRPSTRPILFAILPIILVIVVIVVLLQVFVAQRTPELTEARLEAARELWQQKGPSSYVMDLELRGAQPGTVHVEVRDGKVTTMTRDGKEPPQRTWDVWSVPGQFETLDRELVLAEDPQHEMDVAAGTQLQLRCEFDREYGFPRRYHRFATGGAPEVFWHVTHFEPR